VVSSDGTNARTAKDADMHGLLRDREDAGRRLATALEERALEDAVVVGLARGGLPVAAEVAGRLGLPLDAVAVRKIGHPWQPEYALGAAAPGPDGVFIRSHDGLGEDALAAAIAVAKADAEELDRVLHRRRPPLDLHGKTAVLVDDGLATGATMVAAVRWARSHEAARVVVAVPVGAREAVCFLRREADELVCLFEPDAFGAVGLWYEEFPQVGNDEVVAMLEAQDSRVAVVPG
jgi:predicted phosphoribosyltransferase